MTPGAGGAGNVCNTSSSPCAYQISRIIRLVIPVTSHLFYVHNDPYTHEIKHQSFNLSNIFILQFTGGYASTCAGILCVSAGCSLKVAHRSL